MRVGTPTTDDSDGLPRNVREQSSCIVKCARGVAGGILEHACLMHFAFVPISIVVFKAIAGPNARTFSPD